MKCPGSGNSTGRQPTSLSGESPIALGGCPSSSSSPPTRSQIQNKQKKKAEPICTSQAHRATVFHSPIILLSLTLQKDPPCPTLPSGAGQALVVATHHPTPR